jgi:hypothetical protein
VINLYASIFFQFYLPPPFSSRALRLKWWGTLLKHWGMMSPSQP